MRAALFVRRFFVQESDRRDVEQNEGGGEKNGADDIGQPMHARHESADDGDDGEEVAKQSDRGVGVVRLDEVTARKGCCRKDATSEHGVRGGIGGFKRTADQDGAVVDHNDLEESIEDGNEDIKEGEDQDLAVDSPNGFSFCKLTKTNQGENTGTHKRDDACKFGKLIPKVAYAERVKYGLVQSCKTDFGGDACRLVINHSRFSAERHDGGERHKKGEDDGGKGI